MEVGGGGEEIGSGTVTVARKPEAAVARRSASCGCAGCPRVLLLLCRAAPPCALRRCRVCVHRWRTRRGARWPGRGRSAQRLVGDGEPRRRVGEVVLGRSVGVRLEENHRRAVGVRSEEDRRQLLLSGKNERLRERDGRGEGMVTGSFFFYRRQADLDLCKKKDFPSHQICGTCMEY